METKRIENSQLSDDGWEAEGRVRTKDIYNIMKRIKVRFKVSDPNSGKKFARVIRDRTVIWTGGVPLEATQKEIKARAKKLNLDGIKEAIEQTYKTAIPQEYINSVEEKSSKNKENNEEEQ